MPKKQEKISFFPKGTAEVSTDAIHWEPVDEQNHTAIYAKTKSGKYYRKPREAKDYRDWRPVTAAHINTAAREGWYAPGGIMACQR